MATIALSRKPLHGISLLKMAVALTMWLMMAVLTAKGQMVSDSAQIYFHQGKTELLPDYKNNGKSLSRLLERLDSLSAPGDTAEYVLKGVRVEGAASPEGSTGINRRLSEGRAGKIFDYFSTRVNLPDSLTSMTFVGRDWPGLLQLVEGDGRVPYRREVIELLKTSEKLGGTTPGNELLARLKALRGGEPYRYMYAYLFPWLRTSRIYVEYERRLAALPEEEPVVVEIEEEEAEITEVTEPVAAEPVVMPRQKECKPFYMALKSNLIHDALALPSISAEFYLGRNWSVVGNWSYGWWDSNSRHRYWRAYGGDIAIRKWIGKKANEKPLSGHHVGVYGGVFTYDFEFGGTGYMGGKPKGALWDRCMRMAGVEYGYSLPVGRRVNIDFTIGLGYAGGRYIKYRPSHSGRTYVWESTHNLNWWGPTKAEISVTWLLGHGNINRKK